MPETLASRVFEAHRSVDFRMSFTVIIRLDSDRETTKLSQSCYDPINEDIDQSNEQ